MKKKLVAISLFFLISSISVDAQRLASPVVGQYRVPDDILIKIAKAEDARNFEPLASLLTNVNAAVRFKATLAAGRIGDEGAVPALIERLADDSVEVRAIAAFALGEIESVKAADAVMNVLRGATAADLVRARAVEAAGKIVAANPRHDKTKSLGEAILDALETEDKRGAKQNREIILAAITATLRARPAEGDFVVAKFLTNLDARIRADAGNTLARLRSKNANAALRLILQSDDDPNARANAAKALGAADDKEAFNLLLASAAEDDDSRVRVSAVGSLAALKDKTAVPKLIEHGRKLLALLEKSKYRNPNETTELLTIATALGQLMPNTEDQQTVIFLNQLRMADGFGSPETEIALARVAPKAYVEARLPPGFGYGDRRVASAYAQGLQVLAASTDKDLKMAAAQKLTTFIDGMAKGVKPRYQSEMLKAMPDLQQANAAFKPDNLNEILLGLLENDDVNVRSTAAGAIAAQPMSAANLDALKKAFSRAMIVDKMSDDAQLAMLGALNRLSKKESVGIFLTALNAPNYLVRRRAFQLLADPDLQKEFPGIAASLEIARKGHKDQVLPYQRSNGSKLGQLLNTDVDYRRALSRKNFFFNDTATTEIYTLSLHDALPICRVHRPWSGGAGRRQAHRRVLHGK